MDRGSSHFIIARFSKLTRLYMTNLISIVLTFGSMSVAVLYATAIKLRATWSFAGLTIFHTYVTALEAKEGVSERLDQKVIYGQEIVDRGRQE